MARSSARSSVRERGARWRRRAVLPAILGLACVASLSLDLSSAEFRRRVPVRTPEAVPDGAIPVTAFRPVDRAMVEEGLKKIFAAYSSNPASLGPMLAERFHRKSLLLDTMSQNLPSDARVRLLSLDAVNTLGQHVMPGEGGKPDVLVSMVNATARTQFIYNDRVLGFRSLEGTADYLLRVRQPLRKQPG